MYLQVYSFHYPTFRHYSCLYILLITCFLSLSFHSVIFLSLVFLFPMFIYLPSFTLFSSFSPHSILVQQFVCLHLSLLLSFYFIPVLFLLLPITGEFVSCISSNLTPDIAVNQRLWTNTLTCNVFSRFANIKSQWIFDREISVVCEIS